MKTNRVPAAPIVSVIRSYLAEDGDRVTDGVFETKTVFLLAERADVKADTLLKIISGRSATMDFDIADRLLCVMNLTDLWRTELREIYDSVPLGENGHKPERASGAKVCARAGCSAMFMQPYKTPPKIYCSSTCCAAAAWQRKHGIKTQMRGKGRILEKMVCRNGHERTPENTGWNGVANYCRVCKRESARLRNQLRKEKQIVSQ